MPQQYTVVATALNTEGVYEALRLLDRQINRNGRTDHYLVSVKSEDWAVGRPLVSQDREPRRRWFEAGPDADQLRLPFENYLPVPVCRVSQRRRHVWQLVCEIDGDHVTAHLNMSHPSRSENRIGALEVSRRMAAVEPLPARPFVFEDDATPAMADRWYSTSAANYCPPGPRPPRRSSEVPSEPSHAEAMRRAYGSPWVADPSTPAPSPSPETSSTLPMPDSAWTWGQDRRRYEERMRQSGERAQRELPAATRGVLEESQGDIERVISEQVNTSVGINTATGEIVSEGWEGVVGQINGHTTSIIPDPHTGGRVYRDLEVAITGVEQPVLIRVPEPLRMGNGWSSS